MVAYVAGRQYRAATLDGCRSVVADTGGRWSSTVVADIGGQRSPLRSAVGGRRRRRWSAMVRGGCRSPTVVADAGQGKTRNVFKQMAGDEVKLLGFWGSPYTLRVKWAHILKGIEYEYIEEDISNKSLMLLQYNPLYKKVPVLVHNGKPVVESFVIMEYIDETWKNSPLLPKDPFERAVSRFWGKFIDEKCVPLIIKMLLSTPDQKHKVAEEARESLKTLESSLSRRKPFYGGDSLGFMDIAVAWLGIWVPLIEKITNIKLMDDEYSPLLNAYFKDVLDVQVIKECVPPLDKLNSLALEEVFTSLNSEEKMKERIFANEPKRKLFKSGYNRHIEVNREQKTYSMARDEVTLLGFWGSPFTLRVKWALGIKGIEYEYFEEDLSNKSSMLLQSNPVYKKIPVLIHNGKSIAESLVIIEYIDETWKNHPLLSEDPFERAQSRFWAKFVDDKCVPTIFATFSSTLDQKDKAAKEARENLKLLESSLNPNNPFFGGKNLGFMDIVVAWLGIWAQLVEKIVHVKLLDDENTPLLNAWFKDVLEDQVIKACLPPLDKLLAHNKDFHDKLIAAKA
ncbi:hypothetical protein OSB04_025208 [Centaurea solstitialis]|uniref:Probable glutathione S-transferase n=1 Tax=Centaurea solstitialis TaxID=347529 RepID=A0AA38SZB4_9ASTR|nr:hypothetical protein OSB04_025208 [Centaurea solstitialis]